MAAPAPDFAFLGQEAGLCGGRAGGAGDRDGHRAANIAPTRGLDVAMIEGGDRRRDAGPRRYEACWRPPPTLVVSHVLVLGDLARPHNLCTIDNITYLRYKQRVPRHDLRLSGSRRWLDTNHRCNKFGLSCPGRSGSTGHQKAGLAFE